MYKRQITFNGKKYSPKSPADGLEAGIGLIPEDRKAQGCVLSLTIRENIVYSILKKISKVSVVQKKQEKEIVDQYIKAVSYTHLNLSDSPVKIRRISSSRCCLIDFCSLLSGYSFFRTSGTGSS